MKTVLCFKITEIPVKAFPGICKSRRGGKPRTRTDENGVGRFKRLLQPFRFEKRLFCPVRALSIVSAFLPRRSRCFSLPFILHLKFFRDGLYGTLLEAISAMQAVLLCDAVGCSRCNALLRTDLSAFPAADALPGDLVTFWRAFSLSKRIRLPEMGFTPK